MNVFGSTQQERQQAEQWVERFAQDPTLDTWSTPDMARFMAFQALDQTGITRGARMLQAIGIATEYGKSYMRRTLRFTGISAPIAQDIVDGIEIATIVGSFGASAGVKAGKYVANVTAQATRHLTQKGAQLLTTTQKTTHAWVNKASDVTRKAHHTFSKARDTAQVYLEYDLPNALERAFAPGGYSKAERELLQYGDMFEPSRRDFWGPSSRDFLVHPTRTAQLTRTSRGPHAAPASSYTIPVDDTPLLFPDLPVSTRPTQVPLWDIRGSTSGASNYVASVFQETSYTRPTVPVLKQASLFSDNPSYVVQKLNIKMPKARALRTEAIPEGSKLIPLGKPGRFMFDNVEFRAVRDLSHLSNEELEIMSLRGIAAKDINGVRLEGHHFKQVSHRDPDGFVIEIPETNHRYSNKVQHPFGPEASLSEMARKEWENTLRKQYWKERAKTELLRRSNKWTKR